MRRPLISYPRLLALAAVAAAGTAGPAAAQESGGWRVAAGGGAAVLLSGHDRSDPGQASPTLRVGLTHPLGARTTLGAEWWGVWPGNRVAGGRGRRHHVGVVLSYRAESPGAVVSVGIGPGLATVVDQDGPPEPPHVGDAVIGVGDTTALGVTASAGRSLDAAGLTLLPRVGVLVQQAGGHTLSHGTLTLSVAFGL